MGLPAAICRKLMCKWKDPSPRSGRSEGNTNPAAATGDDALIRAATPTTRLYTFLINHLKFLTVRGGLNQVLPQLKGRGAGPALLAALVGVMGVLVPLCGIAWSCQALLGAVGTALSRCSRFRGHSPSFSHHSRCLPWCWGRWQPGRARGRGGTC